MEKGKVNIGLSGLLLICLLLTITVSIITVVVYNRFTLNKEENLGKVNANRINENESKEVLTNIDKNSEANKLTSSGLEIKNDDAIRVIMPININNQKHELVLEYLLGKEVWEGQGIYEQEIKVYIDGKRYKDIEKGSVPNKQVMPEISIMDTEDGKQVVIMVVKKYLPAGGPKSEIYVLDENGNNLGKISDYGATSMVISQTGEKLNSYTIYGNHIEIPTPKRDLEIHSYTVKDGTLKDAITKKYSEGEWTGAGAR